MEGDNSAQEPYVPANGIPEFGSTPGQVQQTLKLSKAVPGEKQQSRSGIFPVILPKDIDHKITLSFQR